VVNHLKARSLLLPLIDIQTGSEYLLAWADELSEIKTICHCGRKATFNARVDADGRMVCEGNQVEIGDNTRYVSVCRRHFRRNQPFREADSNADDQEVLTAQ
jgi:thymidine kinase